MDVPSAGGSQPSAFQPGRQTGVHSGCFLSTRTHPTMARSLSYRNPSSGHPTPSHGSSPARGLGSRLQSHPASARATPGLEARGRACPPALCGLPARLRCPMASASPGPEMEPQGPHTQAAPALSGSTVAVGASPLSPHGWCTHEGRVPASAQHPNMACHLSMPEGRMAQAWGQKALCCDKGLQKGGGDGAALGVEPVRGAGSPGLPRAEVILKVPACLQWVTGRLTLGPRQG